MIIDIHGHVVAPPELYEYKAGLVSHRGYHTGGPSISDERLEAFAQRHLKELDEVGTDIQFISPRPFQMMHSEKPEVIVHRWIQTVNDAIARQVKRHPERLQGMGGLPQSAGVSPKNCFEELERCVKELGFLGVLLNPDPGEGDGQTPPLSDEYWYPLYEKLVELDVPALVHSAGCKSIRESYSNHFITEESRAILSLIDGQVLQDFPKLKLIISHGGGSIPYQIGRWRANYWRNYGSDSSFDENLRRLYFDTCLYNQESLEFLFRMVGSDRCMFGTEKPGTGSVKDPKTGKWLDDVRPMIEAIPGLTDKERKAIFEDNAKQVFSHLKVAA